MLRPLRARSAIFLLLTICVVVGAINATLMYDDPFLYELFQNMTATHSPFAVAKFLFLGLDLGGAQYRLYGLSKVLQYALWLVVGVSPWIYGAVIGGTQAVSGLIVFDVFQRWGADRLQATLLGLTWALSPFAVTTAFHHYSYLILPYQLAFVCVAIIQHGQDSGRWVWRAAAAVVAACLSLSGEADIPAALTLLYFAAMIAPKGYPLSSRFLDFFIPMAVIIAVAVTHYWVWTRLTSEYQGATRFYPTLLTFSQLAEIGPGFFSTLFQGLSSQVQAIVSFAGAWVIAALIPAGIVVFVALYQKNTDPGSGWPLAILATAFAASWSLYAIIAAAGQGVVDPGAWRHYGYIPNTFLAMLVVAAASSSAVRRLAGVTPAALCCGAVVWLWFTLQFVCLPVVRAQDRVAWITIADEMQARHKENLLILADLRGDAPDVFQSPLSAVVWESAYARVALGAAYAADRARLDADGTVRLFARSMWWQVYPSEKSASMNTVLTVTIKGHFPKAPLVFDDYPPSAQTGGSDKR